MGIKLLSFNSHFCERIKINGETRMLRNIGGAALILGGGLCDC